MNKIFDKFEPGDVVAVLVIVGIIIANWRGIEFMVPQAGLLIIGYYFGRKLSKNGV